MFLAPPPPTPHHVPPVTIWVHGTRPSAIFPFLSTNDKVQKKVDASIPSAKGLRPFADLKPTGKTHALLKALSISNPEQFPLESLYSFGWSGNLDVAARKAAAEKLYSSIKKLVTDLSKVYGKAPPLKLISHSHGGNVILHMAHLIDQDSSLSFDRTILLACPVQKETSHLAQHPMFGTVYSIHSHVDIVQILDPQRLQPYKNAFAVWQEKKSFDHVKEAYFIGLAHPFFSERHFPHTPNIIQVNICWKSGFNGTHNSPTSNKIETFFHSVARRIIDHPRGVLHTEFITPGFMQHLPSVISSLDTQQQTGLSAAKDIQILI